MTAPGSVGLPGPTGMRSAAVKLASEGFRVFPLIPDKKRPLIENWQARATSDAFTVLETWPGERSAPGVCTNGYVVLDADKDKGGLEAVLRLFDGKLPHTRIVRTGNGGLHIYFRAPAGMSFSTRACIQRKDGTRSEAIPGHFGIDIRAQGGLVVGPGAVIDGKAYKLEVDAPIAELPPFLAELLKHAAPKAPEAGQVVGELDTPAAIERAVRYLTDEAPVAREDFSGDPQTIAVTNRVLDFGIDPETALDLMAEHWNERCEPPWDYENLAYKVASAAKTRQDPIGRDMPGLHFGVIDHPPGGAGPAPTMPPKLVTSGTRRLAPVRADMIEERTISWLYFPYIPAGAITLIGSRGGAGKGLVCSSLVATITTKSHWPASSEKAEKGRILWAEAEDPAGEVLVPRWRAAGADRALIDFVDLQRYAMGDLKAYVRERQPRLIVFSPFTTFLDGLSDANSEIDARSKLQVIQDAVAGTHCAAVGICHLNKKPDLAAVERLLGTVAFTNFVRSVMLINVEEPETRRARLVHAKHNWGPKGSDLLYTPRNVGPLRGQEVRLDWERPDTNVDPEALYDRKPNKQTASAWHAEYLKSGSIVPKERVLTDGLAAGHSKEAIEKAQQRNPRAKSKIDGFQGKAVWWLDPS